MDWSAIPFVVRGMGFNCSRGRSHLKVYFHFLALLIPIPLVVRGNGPSCALPLRSACKCYTHCRSRDLLPIPNSPLVVDGLVCHPPCCSWDWLQLFEGTVPAFRIPLPARNQILRCRPIMVAWSTGTLGGWVSTSPWGGSPQG